MYNIEFMQIATCYQLLKWKKIFKDLNDEKKMKKEKWRIYLENKKEVVLNLKQLQTIILFAHELFSVPGLRKTEYGV